VQSEIDQMQKNKVERNINDISSNRILARAKILG